MSFRKKMSRKGSKKIFARTASKTKQVNIAPKIMRGGIRL